MGAVGIFGKSKAYSRAMNSIFSFLFMICAFLLLCSRPDAFLPALLDGASKAAAISLSLVASYCVWLGIMRIWEDCGVSRSVAKRLKPIASRVLKTENDEAIAAACMGISANALGISGAATPYGVKTIALLDQTENAEYASAVFFALSASSLQLFPTSLISMRVGLGSGAPTDIVLPILLTSAFLTVLSVSVTAAVFRKAAKKPKGLKGGFGAEKRKTTGAGTR